MTSNEQSTASGRGQSAPDESEVLVDPILLEPARNGHRAQAPAGPPRAAVEDGDEPLPSFSEQLASQLGGARGVIESGIPVAVFVIANILASLNLALIVSVASAVVIAIYRLSRRQTIRHAVNGLLGIGIGAFIAWKTGSAKAFYLPGILISFGYGVAMLASVPLRRPLVGWAWSVLADGGRRDWLDKPKMVKLFNRLTIVWAVTYLVKTVIQAWVFNNTAAHDPATALGIARLVLGYPPYAALLAYTVWSVRKTTARDPSLTAPAG